MASKFIERILQERKKAKKKPSKECVESEHGFRIFSHREKEGMNLDYYRCDHCKEVILIESEIDRRY